ncbi:hypothetical protein KKF61_08595 [Patescibacteria group bacterium]|nr:hypothetical protein [Patescibacteria group bacterium]
MSKKDEAFELFAQGKGPKDPEVADLGLKKASRVRYYRLWLKHNKPVIPVVATPATVVATVPLSQIPLGKNFEYKGKVYKKQKVIKDFIIGWLGPSIYDDIALGFNTPVIPRYILEY